MDPFHHHSNSNYNLHHHQWHPPSSQQQHQPNNNSICPFRPYFPPQNPNFPFPPPPPPPPPPLAPPPPHHHHHHHHHHNHQSPWQMNDRSYKRPRFDDGIENERRLKLIRDHGSGGGAMPRGNHHQEMYTNVSDNYSSNNANGFHFNNVNVNVNAHFTNAPSPPVYGGGYFTPPPVSSPPPHPPAVVHPAARPEASSFSLFPVTGSSSSAMRNSPSLQVPNAPTSSSGQSFQQKQLPSLDKPKVIDASHLFKPPHRVSRPDHFVIILRGLPGSGKSYLAKMLRDIEVENGGNAPRIHSMDDYFMTEVEKVEENDASTSSSSARSKKPVMKKVIEYCYEPEMEEAYRSSMLKAFKRTLDEGVFTFIIVDDRNLRVADFAQFWATAKRSGYEAYVLEAAYKDPAGCAARNVHGFSLEEIQKMAEQWEEAPSLYMQLDIKSLSHGDDLKESGIQEVDMDMEDDFGLQERKSEKSTGPAMGEDVTEDTSKDEHGWNAEGDRHTEEVKELSRSKWSNLEEDDIAKANSNTLSGLSQAHPKEGKSVRWGDQGGDTGFSIGAAKAVNSLVIGPGAGYNMKSNPLSEEESLSLAKSLEKSKIRSVFQEQLRAERESFKAVFDRRKHRIGGLDFDEE